MNKQTIKSSLILLLTASIWGVAFVAQSVGMDYVGPFTMNCVRSLLGGLVLIPVILIFRRKPRNADLTAASPDNNRTRYTLPGGICCGICLCLASNFQQLGLRYTTVGKAGFITAFYIVIVPVLGLFIKRKCSRYIWLSVFLALLGLYLLCMSGDFELNFGDLLLLICAFLFAVHILIIDRFASLTDNIAMSCIQFFVSGLLSGIPMLLFEEPTFAGIYAARLPILYSGVFSCGVAYTLQIVGQKNLNPAVASLILSLEASISVMAGFILLHEKLTIRELAGCAVMFAAIIIAQLLQSKKEAAVVN